MAKYYYYSITVIISLFIIASCAPESTPTGNDAVYQLSVTVDPPEAGTVTPGSAELTEGDEVEITASPNEGWIFDRWQGDHTGSENPVTITMDRDKDILALFIKKEYPLTVTIEGEGTVSERVVQNNTTDYSHGTTVELTANPASGWVFSHWEGDVDTEGNPVQIVIDSEKEVTAVFVSREFNLVTHIEGEGTVSERIIQDPSTSYQIVELTANPSEGWRFVEWKGDISGSDNPVRTTMDEEKQVTAVFEKRDYPLTIHKVGDGTVVEEVIQGKIADYPHGTTVQLTANPAQGWNFSRWEGDLTGSDNPSQIEVTEAKEVTAIFERNTYQISVNVEGEGSVTETLASGSGEEGVYEFNSVVELSARPSDGWRFSHWTGDVDGSANPVSVEMDSDKNVTAVFEQRSYDLTILIEGEGTVSEEEVEEDKVVKITATAASGWIFDRWEGDLTGSENPSEVEITTEKEITAIFKKGHFALDIEVNGNGSVETDLQSGNESGGLYEFGSEVRLTASADTGWRFDHWSGDASGDTNPVTITIGVNNNVSATFDRQTFALSTDTEGEGSVSDSLVSGTAAQGGYLYESVVELAATPAAGWVFSHWTGDVSGSENPEEITITDEKEVTAVFEQETFTLTVDTEGEGSVGRTLLSGSESDGQYESGSVVELTAAADEGWEFIRWEGDLEGDQNPQSITIEANKTVTAVFEEEESEFSGGDGTVTNPYQVSNTDELQRMADYPDAHFVQINNIDASATASWNGENGFNPIGALNSPFRGTYDGSGFEISGLTINRPDNEYVGLFGNADGATIKNTRLVNVTIAGGQYAGGLVGLIYSSGTIENSYATGNVSGSRDVGGLAGSITGTQLSNSHAIVEVSGDVNVGGLVGNNGSLGGHIFDSYAEGDVSGNEKVGGLVGVSSRKTTIRNSYATGTVTGTGDQIGGLVGLVDYGAHITGSHAKGNVTGDERVGGLVGDNGGGSINSCYATGNISGNSMLGGLVGKIVGPGVIDESHASGNVTGGDMLGGLVGSKYASHINDSYAIGDINGKDEIGGLAGSSIAGQIKNSYALGRVTGEDAVGGLVGVNDTGGHNVHDAGQIFNSYAHGAVTGENGVGGLVGINTNQAVITTSYAKGRVSGDDNIGGLVGLNEADIVSSYWDIEATDQIDGTGDGSMDGVTGLTTSEMTDASAESNMPEFDWNSIWMTTTEYPVQRWQGGNLTSN